MLEQILTPISPGELLDKISILELKRDRIADPDKRANVMRELTLLEDVVAQSVPPSPELDALMERIRAVNTALWDIEDAIRVCERAQDFGVTFIRLARSVYVTNDERAAIKKEINLLLGSPIVEEKSYEDYQSPPA